MKQVLQSYRDGELWLADVPEPAVKPRGSLVRTACSVVSSGTERMVIQLARKSLLAKARERPDLVKRVISKVKSEGLTATLGKVFAKLDHPISHGYSCSGTVVQIGRGVSSIRPGDRVACAGAGYATHAEYNYIPENLTVRIPEAVSDEDAAFTTIGAIAMQGVRQADIRLGERVAVIGLGLIGLVTVQLLKASGCRVLGFDPDETRCAKARSLGADVAISSGLVQACSSFSMGHGVDAVIITASTDSNQPIEDAAEISRVKGKVVVVGVVGMNVPRNAFYAKELDLRLSMSYGPGRYDASYEERGHDYPIGHVRWTERRNMEAFLDLVAQGVVTPSAIVSHSFSIDEAMRAYELLEDASNEPVLGILLKYAEQSERAASRNMDLAVVPTGAKLGVGVIGAGAFGKGVLLPHLESQDVDLISLCTTSGMSGVEAGKKYGFSSATTDVGDVLDDDRVKAVIIATRHDSHANLVEQALSKRKHVLVEKPLALDEEELSRVMHALEAQGGQSCLAVGFNRRYSSHAKAVADCFRDRGSSMAISYRVNAGSIPGDSWLQQVDEGGGRIIGEVCHFVDLCSFLTGSAVAQVFAIGTSGATGQARVEDSVAVSLRYKDGSIAMIQYFTAGSSRVPKEHIEVYADDRTAVIDNFETTKFFGVNRASIKGKQDKGFAGELEAFVHAAQDGGVPPISIHALVNTTRSTFAIEHSLRMAQPVDVA